MSILPFLSRWCAIISPRNERNPQVTPFAQSWNRERWLTSLLPSGILTKTFDHCQPDRAVVGRRWQWPLRGIFAHRALRHPSAPNQTDGTGQRWSLARIASADLVQTKGLGLALCSAR